MRMSSRAVSVSAHAYSGSACQHVSTVPLGCCYHEHKLSFVATAELQHIMTMLCAAGGKHPCSVPHNCAHQAGRGVPDSHVAEQLPRACALPTAAELWPGRECYRLHAHACSASFSCQCASYATAPAAAAAPAEVSAVLCAYSCGSACQLQGSTADCKALLLWPKPVVLDLPC